MDKVLSGLQVYPDNMLKELVESRGCYAVAEAKELLKELGAPLGLLAEEAYRIVQLAAFNLLEPSLEQKMVRDLPAWNFDQAATFLQQWALPPIALRPRSIEDYIPLHQLHVSNQLAAKEADVVRWNEILEGIFALPSNCERWHGLFEPSYLLRNESVLFKQILGS
jgi:hypothetical protein